MTYAEAICSDFSKNRDYLTESLKNPDSYPMEAVTVEGGYFLMADISKCKDLIVVQYSVQVFNPNRIYGTVTLNPIHILVAFRV